MSLHDQGSKTGRDSWYDLFSRGTRDWLRHNEKVREAVKDQLPDLIAGSDVMSRPGKRSVKVPIKFMQHHRFTLLEGDPQQGVGQGEAKAGDVLRPAQPGGRGVKGGGEGESEITFVLEFQVDDILDWMWSELSLPNLKPREGSSLEQDRYVREGWDKRGARSRLDRRRTLKESIKRRSAIPDSGLSISNEDLRFRQLVKRSRPTTNAVVFFLLDVSSSMDQHCRKLAKSFFFWALQGIRRQFTNIDTVFIAHTVEAWEFQEEEFFQVRGEGGTRSSSGLHKLGEILEERFDPSQYNCYLFYATDGHNFSDDRSAATEAIMQLAPLMNFCGYAQVSHQSQQQIIQTEVAQIWQALTEAGIPCGSYGLSNDSDIWPAIQAFFTDQVSDSEATNV